MRLRSGKLTTPVKLADPAAVSRPAPERARYDHIAAQASAPGPDHPGATRDNLVGFGTWHYNGRT